MLLVLFFHGSFSWASGGFLGVSLFFTLSGFLITRLLLADHRNHGRIRFAAFWERRARRLIPAALVAVALVVVVAPYVWNTSQRSSLPGDVVSAVTYSANWHALWSGNSYGSLFATPSPLEHYWSLAIEEQFYLVMPLLLAAVLTLSHGSRRAVAIVLGACTAVSVFVLVTASSIDRAYYGTDARAAEVLIGALLAVAYPIDRRRARKSPVWAIAGVLALAFTLVMFTTVTFTSSWLYADGGLVLFGFSSAILVRACMVPGPVRALFSWSALRALGLISYGVYLFHWPVFLVLSPQRTGLDQWPLFAVRVAVTLAIALASYVFIERPIRERRALRSWRLPAILLATAAVVAVGATFVGSDRADGISQQTLRKVSHLPQEPAPTAVTQAQASLPKPLRVYVVGDSIGTYFATGLYDWGQAHPGTVVVYANAHSSCPITRGGSQRFREQDTPSDMSECDADIARWSDDLRAFAPDVVVVATGPTNTVDRQVPGDAEWRGPGDPVLDQFLLSQMQQDVDELHQTGAPVLWFDLPYEQRDQGASNGAPLLSSSDPARIDRYNQLLGDLEATRPVSIIRWSTYFDKLSVEDDLALRESDGIHLTTTSTQKLLDQWLWAEIGDDYLAAK